MNNQQESRLSMYIGFKEFQTPYSAITNLLPNYTTNSTVFTNTIPQIQAISEQQRIDKSGLTDNKNQLKEVLIVNVADYSRKLGVYAKFTNNMVLAKEIKFTEGKLRMSSDTAIRDIAQIVYNKAQAVLASLPSYGITAATQTTLINAIAAYNTSIGKPIAGRTERKQVTKQIANLFNTAETALANMDAAVEIIRLSQPAFYEGYKNARKVILTGSGSLTLKGLVVDAISGEPVKGATLSFLLEGNQSIARLANNAVETVIKKTALKGRFNIKSLASGIYKVTVKKVGYLDHEATVAVADGELTEVNIKLTKN